MSLLSSRWIEDVERALLSKDPVNDPSRKDSLAFVNAASSGHTDIVKLLMADPRVDISSRINKAIRLAMIFNHTEIVDLLIDFVDLRVLINRNMNCAEYVIDTLVYRYMDLSPYKHVIEIALRYCRDDCIAIYRLLVFIARRYSDNMDIVEVILEQASRNMLDRFTNIIMNTQKNRWLARRLQIEKNHTVVFPAKIHMVNFPTKIEKKYRQLYKRTLIEFAIGIKQLNIPVLVQLIIVSHAENHTFVNFKLEPTIAWDIAKTIAKTNAKTIADTAT